MTILVIPARKRVPAGLSVVVVTPPVPFVPQRLVIAEPQRDERPDGDGLAGLRVRSCRVRDAVGTLGPCEFQQVLVGGPWPGVIFSPEFELQSFHRTRAAVGPEERIELEIDAPCEMVLRGCYFGRSA